MDTKAGEAWDEIVASRGSIRGPFPYLLHNPELARRVANLGSYVRYESALDRRQREIAMLATFRLLGCAYGWSGHRRTARDAGIAEATIEAIARADGKALDPADLLIYELASELIRDHSVSDEAFRRAHDFLGTSVLLDVVGTIGYTTCIALVLNALGVEAQAS